MLWHTLMAYSVLSRKCEESFNKLLGTDADPDPAHLGGGPSHGYNTSCVKNEVNRSDSSWVTHPDRQTDRQTDPDSHSSVGARVMMGRLMTTRSSHKFAVIRVGWGGVGWGGVGWGGVRG